MYSCTASDLAFCLKSLQRLLDPTVFQNMRILIEIHVIIQRFLKHFVSRQNISKAILSPKISHNNLHDTFTFFSQ